MNNVIHNTALILTIIGGLNWGLVGLCSVLIWLLSFSDQ